MTVAELITSLEKVENKERQVQVYVRSGSLSGVVVVEEVDSETHDTVYIDTKGQ